MTHQQYLSTLALDTAALITRAGGQVLAATAINGRPWLKAKLPATLPPATRRHLLALAWQAPATIEWRTR